MSANFTPSLNSYTDLTPFRFWCQKVLPLVYDDSLSYYELLCKVIDYLNKTMEDVNLSIEDVEKLHTAYDSLQTYVNDYFDNLDVQEEINNKLDALVEDGTIHDIFNSDVEAILNTASQAAQDAIEAIPSNVTAWLDTHVNPKSDVVIDDTLSIQGAAADAKKTGDEISALKSDLNGELSSGDVTVKTDTEIIQNEFVKSDGTLTAETGWDRTDYIPVKDILSVSIEGANLRQNAFFDANKNYISGSFFSLLAGVSKPVPANAEYVIFSDLRERITVAKYFLTKQSFADSVTQRFAEVGTNF